MNTRILAVLYILNTAEASRGLFGGVSRGANSFGNFLNTTIDKGRDFTKSNIDGSRDAMKNAHDQAKSVRNNLLGKNVHSNPATGDAEAAPENQPADPAGQEGNQEAGGVSNPPPPKAEAVAAA